MMSVKSLLGISEEETERFVSLFGMLCRNPSNLSQFFLEDVSGQILLDLSQAVLFYSFILSFNHDIINNS